MGCSSDLLWVCSEGLFPERPGQAPVAHSLPRGEGGRDLRREKACVGVGGGWREGQKVGF